MDQPCVTRTVTILNQAGMHLRAALLVGNLVRLYRAHVEVIHNRQRVDALSILDMMTLVAGLGEQVQLEATGEEAEEVIEALVQLFADKFYEDDLENLQPRAGRLGQVKKPGGETRS
jgi:phosphotransferase system HPr (HPr) family protein